MSPIFSPLPYTTLFRSRSWAPAPIPLDAPDHLDARGRTVDPIGDGGSEASRRHWIRPAPLRPVRAAPRCGDRKSTRLNSSHVAISYAVFCLKKKKIQQL